ncbi:MAG TPA: hypothetical protein VII49_12965 [Rhizomicrobium sp.]
MELEADYIKVREHYAAIGHVAAAWAAFEQRLQWELWALAGIEGVVGAILTANIGVSARFLDAIAALCRYRGADEPSMKALDKLTGKSLGLAKRRNRAVHDPWGFAENEAPYRLEISAAKELKMGAVPVPTTELASLAKEILAHTTTFEDRLREIRRKLAASPDRFP